MLRHERAGALLAVAELGVLVEVAPPLDHALLDAARRAVDRARAERRSCARAEARHQRERACERRSGSCAFPSRIRAGYRRRGAASPRRSCERRARVRSGSLAPRGLDPARDGARLEHGRGLARAAVGPARAAARHVPAQRGRGHAAAPGRPAHLALRRARRRDRRAALAARARGVRRERAAARAGVGGLVRGRGPSRAAPRRASGGGPRPDPHAASSPRRWRSTRRCSARWCSRRASRPRAITRGSCARWWRRASSSRRRAGSRSRPTITSCRRRLRRATPCGVACAESTSSTSRSASEYEPRAGEPGPRALARLCGQPHAARVARARRARARPGCVCLHGYRMGLPLVDLCAFPPDWLHHRLGLNLLLPVLPLHGPRRIGRRSGDGFLGGDLLDTIHAEAQAMWDMRRLLAWVRARSGAPIGVYGLSLGGYTASLLACLDERPRLRDRGHPRDRLRAHVLPPRRPVAGARRAARGPHAGAR